MTLPCSSLISRVSLMARSPESSLPFQNAKPAVFFLASSKSVIFSFSDGRKPVEVKTTLPEELSTITPICSFLSKFSM